MAIIKGTFSTNLKGRVGSVVYRNRNGKNIATQIPASVKNPQSVPQQKQRMKFNTIAQAYKCLKEIVDHSFEGVSYGAQSQARFMKDNLMLYTLQGSKHGMIAKNNSALASGAFKISQGSLPSISYSARDNGDAGANPLEANNTYCELGKTVSRANPTILNVTYADVLEALNIQKGDQLTLMSVISKTMATFGANSTIPQLTDTEVRKARFVFSAVAEDTTKAFVEVAGNTVFNPLIIEESENATDVLVDITDGMIFFKMSEAIANAYAVFAYGVIASRRSGTTWLRSTQYLDPVPATMWGSLLPEDKPEYNYFIVLLSYDPKSTYYLNAENSVL